MRKDLKQLATRLEALERAAHPAAEAA